jgi:hypothetical protein
MADKFVLFDDAAKELKTSADGLKKLMEEGKIRHFMDSGKIKFRQKDVDDLKASLGIKNEEDELSLAPPEDMPPMPPVSAADDVPAPPVAKDEEFSIEPLDEAPSPSTFGSTTAKKKGEPAAAVKAAAQPAAPAEEEIASLSDLEASSEEGQELTGEEAELLAMQGGLRGMEEGKEGNVGMTVLLVVATVIVALSVALLLSFPLSHNPFKSLTDMFAIQ